MTPSRTPGALGAPPPRRRLYWWAVEGLLLLGVVAWTMPDWAYARLMDCWSA